MQCVVTFKNDRKYTKNRSYDHYSVLKDTTGIDSVHFVK